ncbi:hypothetical protein BANAU_1883 [Bacillus velezensis YAU B9601-Y2]|nr:hypothetical protein BANAU_1883 [Bacillus velezensis YAU B9601-Y2]
MILFFIPNEMPLFQHTVSFVQAIHAFCHRILPSDEKRRNMSMDMGMDMNGHYDHHPKQPKQKKKKQDKKHLDYDYIVVYKRKCKKCKKCC